MAITKKNGDYALMFGTLGVAKQFLTVGVRRLPVIHLISSPIIKFVKP